MESFPEREAADRNPPSSGTSVKRTPVDIPVERRKLLFRGSRYALRREQRHRDLHPAVEIADHRAEHGGGEPAHGSHFGEMLVRLPQRILTWGVQLRRGRLHFIFRNHFFAAAAVPGQGKAGKQGSSGKNPCCAQRCGQCDEAAGVASRHGDALCRADCFRLGGGKLRKAVDPSGCGAVGGRGVQHHRVRVFNQGYRLPRRRIG